MLLYQKVDGNLCGQVVSFYLSRNAHMKDTCFRVTSVLKQERHAVEEKTGIEWSVSRSRCAERKDRTCREGKLYPVRALCGSCELEELGLFI